MEAPVFIVYVLVVGQERAGFAVPVYLSSCCFQLHYFKVVYFSFLLKGKSRIPVTIMMMGIVFNVLNGMMQAGGLLSCSRRMYSNGWTYLLKTSRGGGFCSFAGMLINLHSDHVIRHLRKPGDTRHYLP